MAAEAERMPLQALEQLLGQDQLVARDLGQAMELYRDLVMAIEFDRQDVAAKRLAMASEARELTKEPLGQLSLGRHHLHRDLRWPIVPLLGQQEGQRRAIVVDQVEAVLH